MRTQEHRGLDNQEQLQIRKLFNFFPAPPLSLSLSPFSQTHFCFSSDNRIYNRIHREAYLYYREDRIDLSDLREEYRKHIDVKYWKVFTFS